MQIKLLAIFEIAQLFEKLNINSIHIWKYDDKRLTCFLKQSKFVSLLKP